MDIGDYVAAEDEVLPQMPQGHLSIHARLEIVREHIRLARVAQREHAKGPEIDVVPEEGVGSREAA